MTSDGTENRCWRGQAGAPARRPSTGLGRDPHPAPPLPLCLSLFLVLYIGSLLPPATVALRPSPAASWSTVVGGPHTSAPGMFHGPTAAGRAALESYAAMTYVLEDLDDVIVSIFGLPGRAPGMPADNSTSSSNATGPNSEDGQPGQPGKIFAMPERPAKQARGRQLIRARSLQQLQGEPVHASPTAPLVLPPLPTLTPLNQTNSTTVIILAPNRTRRPNPLDHWNQYSGGWDFFSTGYWASLTWSSIYGVIIGLAWAIFGLGFVMFLACMCCFARKHWGNVRDRSLKYDKKDLLLPLIFLVLGVLIACTGLGLSITGAVQFNNAGQNLTNFAVAEVEQASTALLNVTDGLKDANSTAGQLGHFLPASVQAKYNQVIASAQDVASNITATAEFGGRAVSNTLRILQLILFCVCCVTVGFVLIGTLFGLLKWVIASNIVTVIVWFLIFFTWVLVTVFVFVQLFDGDTTSALNQIAAQPTALSKFTNLIPCANPAISQNLDAFGRYVGYTTILVVNHTIFVKSPLVFRVLKAEGGLCNPYGHPPLYEYNNASCTTVLPHCRPRFQKCALRKITIDLLAQEALNFPCNKTNEKECISDELATTIYAAQALIRNLHEVMPMLKNLFQCGYIVYLAQYVASECSKLETAATYLWVGFLLISLGSMIFAICLPIYAYRAVRCYGKHEGDAQEFGDEEDENWADMDDDPKNQNNHQNHDSDEDRSREPSRNGDDDDAEDRDRFDAKNDIEDDDSQDDHDRTRPKDAYDSDSKYDSDYRYESDARGESDRDDHRGYGKH